MTLQCFKKIRKGFFLFPPQKKKKEEEKRSGRLQIRAEPEERGWWRRDEELVVAPRAGEDPAVQETPEHERQHVVWRVIF